MKLTFSGPEHWLTYVTRPLAPFEREEAQAPFRAQVVRWQEEGLSPAEIVAQLSYCCIHPAQTPSGPAPATPHRAL